MASSKRGVVIGCVAVVLVLGGLGTVAALGVLAWLGGMIPGVQSPLDQPLFADVLPELGAEPLGSVPPPVPATTPPVPEVMVPVVPPTPQPVTVRLTSVPPAEVTEGDVVLGTTPLEIPVPAGSTRTVHVAAAGHLPQDVALQATPGEIAVQLTAEPVAVVETPPTTETPPPEEAPRTETARTETARTETERPRTETARTETERPRTATTIRPRTSESTESTGTTTTTPRTHRTGSLSHDDF